MNKEKYETQQEIHIKRGEYERERRKKFLRLKHLGQYLVSKRSEVSKEIKTTPPITAEQKNIMDNYSYLRSVKKGIKYPTIVFIGLLLLDLLIEGFRISFPEIAAMPIGFALVTLYDIAKHKLGVRLP